MFKKIGDERKKLAWCQVDDHRDDYHNVIQQCNKMFNLNKKRGKTYEKEAMQQKPQQKTTKKKR